MFCLHVGSIPHCGVPCPQRPEEGTVKMVVSHYLGAGKQTRSSAKAAGDSELLSCDLVHSLDN